MPTSFPPRYFCQTCLYRPILLWMQIKWHHTFQYEQKKEGKLTFWRGVTSIKFQLSTNTTIERLPPLLLNYSWLNFSTSIAKKKRELTNKRYYSVYSLKPPHLKHKMHITYKCMLIIYLPYLPRPPEDLLIESSNPHSHPPKKIYPKTILRKYLGQLGPTGDNNHILTLHTWLIFSSNFATPICTSHQIRFAHHVLELHVGLTLWSSESGGEDIPSVYSNQAYIYNPQLKRYMFTLEVDCKHANPWKIFKHQSLLLKRNQATPWRTSLKWLSPICVCCIELPM